MLFKIQEKMPPELGLGGTVIGFPVVVVVIIVVVVRDVVVVGA
jgi:hypothetical protein